MISARRADSQGNHAPPKRKTLTLHDFLLRRGLSGCAAMSEE